MTKSRSLIILLLLCLLAAARAGAESRKEPSRPPPAAAALPAVQGAKALPVTSRRLSLKTLSGKAALPLRTTEGSAEVSFGARADELVVQAFLHLQYTFSPALIPGQSHLKITVNDKVAGVVPVTKENTGREMVELLKIDPRLFADFNRVRITFIGHYAADCEDPLHSSLWSEINGESELELAIQPLAVASELALLPEPFFDHRDSRRLNLPFVFSAAPAMTTLNGGAILSSWFGQLSAWRGANFPARLDRLPPGHAVLFATKEDFPSFLAQFPPSTEPGQERPAFIARLPQAEGPTLEVVTNPVDGYSKLLLITGRDSADLLTATRTLALGYAALSGPRGVVTEVKGEAPRQPYDAPNWIRIDRPVKFGELVATPQDLQVYGHLPDAVRIDLRIPPDLFIWQSRGVPVDLKFRYTPPIRSSESRLNMGINNELVRSFNLRASGEGGESARVRLPLLDDLLFSESSQILLPAFKLGASNQLQFNFAFTYFKQGFCQDTLVENVRAMIDADSTVDFSGFPHYAELPNLNTFASAGFPFTKYADLAQTVVVLPEKPAAEEIQVMLTLMGNMGQATGYPAIRVRLSGPEELQNFANAELLVIGALPGQGLLNRWQKHLPASVSAASRQIKEPARVVSFLYDWLGFKTAPDPAVLAEQTIASGGPLALLMGFESPISPGRSVVALTGAAAPDLELGLEALADAGLKGAIHGSVAFIHPRKVASFLVGPTYATGYLPLWTTVWYWLSNRPILLAFMAVLAVLTFAFALWRTLKVIAAKRIAEDS